MGYPDFLELLLVFVLDLLLHSVDQFLDFVTEITHFLLQAPHLLDLLQIVDLYDILLVVIEQVHLSVQFLLLLLQLLQLLLLLDLQVLQELRLVLPSAKLLVAVCDLLPLALVNQDVVEIAKVGQVGNQMCLVLAVPFAVFDGEGVAVDVQDLQVFKPGLFFGGATKVGENFFKGAYEVVANREDVEFAAVVEAIDEGYLVVIEGQVCKVDEFVEALNRLDAVEGEVKPLQVRQVVDVLDLLDDVVIQLQLFEPQQCVQILDFKNVWMGPVLLRKERERTFIFPKFIWGSFGMILFSLR